MLPKISQPTYSIYLHSLKKNVDYRPYTTGEEKILMMVSESDDPKFISKNIKKVLQSCVLDPDVDVGKLASYDIENLLLKIRAKSAGEVIEMKYSDPETGETEEFAINIEELDVTFDPEHEYNIKITDTVGLIMKDLTFDKILEYQNMVKQKNISNAEVTFTTIIDSVESVYDGDNIYKIGEETSRDELVEFINSLSGITKKLYKFIQTRPAVLYELTLKNGKKEIIRDFKSFLG